MKKHALPKPNAQFHRPGEGKPADTAEVNGIICNPIYTGLGKFPQQVDDEAWITAAGQFIAEEGAEQFLVNLLYLLRKSLAADTPAMPQLPLLCAHDGLAIIDVGGGDWACIGEFLFAHLYNTTVTDLISEPVLTLVFQNGHTMPLLCPDCGQSLHVHDEDLLLNTLNGLSIVDMGHDPDTNAVILDFGKFPDDIDAEAAFMEHVEPLESLEVHLSSIRGITCPHTGERDRNRDREG